MMRRVKAFIIATLSFVFPVSWGRPRTRKRCKFAELNSFEHPLLVKFLGLIFDVRTSVKGNTEIWFREREKVIQRRRIRKFWERVTVK